MPTATNNSRQGSPLPTIASSMPFKFLKPAGSGDIDLLHRKRSLSSYFKARGGLMSCVEIELDKIGRILMKGIRAPLVCNQEELSRSD